MPAGGPWCACSSLWSWSWAWVAVAMGTPLDRLPALLARGLDFGRLDHVARLVAPGVARVRDDRGELGVGQLRERRHSRAGLALQLERDLRRLGTVDDLGAV